MFEINKQVHENTINFLYEAATTILPKANPSLKLLKSFYINKTREIARCENLNIPNKVYGPVAMCQKCSVPWGEGTCKVSVYSTKPKNSKKMNFIMAPKTKYSRKNIKKFVVLKCTVCKSRKKQTLSKPLVSKVKPLTQLARRLSQTVKLNNRPQITVLGSKKLKTKSSKAGSKKPVQKSNENHILQLAKLLSSSTSRPTAALCEDKLKQFLK